MIKTFDKLPSYIQQKFQEVGFDPSKSESAKVDVKGKLAKVFLLIDGDRSFCVLEQNTSKQLFLNLFKTEKEPGKIWSTINTLPKNDFEKFVRSLNLVDSKSNNAIFFMMRSSASNYITCSYVYHKKNPQILVDGEDFKIENSKSSPNHQRFENFNLIRITIDGVINDYILATQEFINQK